MGEDDRFVPPGRYLVALNGRAFAMTFDIKAPLYDRNGHILALQLTNGGLINFDNVLYFSLEESEQNA
jgi:hypothetical protein